MTLQTANGFAAGFEQYGFFPYLTGLLLLFVVTTLAFFVTGKAVFARELIEANKRLDANTAIMANMENSSDAEVRGQLQRTTEELKDTKMIITNLSNAVSTLSAQNEKLSNILEAVRDDLRDIKSRGGGRSA